MAVALPDALPPAQSTPADIKAQANESGTFSFNQFTVHLIGQALLDEAAINRVKHGAESLSDIVRNISSEIYLAGYPGVQVYYAREGDDLFVLTFPGKITEVTGDSRVSKYFSNVPGTSPTRDTDIEKARSLANTHSDRAGENVKLLLKPNQQVPGESSLVLKQQVDKPDPTSIRGEFGNPGNRFVGRHFLKLDLEHGFATGDQVSVSWNHGLTGLNNRALADDFNEQSVVWNRVTPWGIFGISGFNEDYTIQGLDNTGQPVDVNGDLQKVEGAWLYPIQKSFDSSWTANLTVDYIDKEFALASTGTLAQSQKYGSVEVGTSYAHTLLVRELPLTLGAGLAVRQGLGDDKVSNPIVLADLGYFLVRPQVSAELASVDWSASLQALMQITEDAVPEQSQWVMGGVGNVSAYLPGVAVGDSGGIVRAEFRYKALPEWRDFSLTPSVFAEYGYTKFEDPLNTPVGGGLFFVRPTSTAKLADVGLDLNLKWQDYVTLRLTYAESVDEDNVSSAVQRAADANVYFSLVVNL